MKTKFSFLMVLVSLFSFSVSMAQQASAQKIEGTPYLTEKYVDGEILFGTTGRSAVPLRYNVFQDLMEYQQNGKALVLDPSTKIKRVKLGESTYVVDKFEYDGKTKYGFLNLLDSGKVTLLAKKVVKYQAPLKGRALDGGDVPAKFSRSSDTYFYRIGNGELQEVNNLKDMIASFPDKQEELKQFAKKEKISPKKEDELLKLVRYYNSL
ncbi:MAG TPA: hypothetical protein VFZ52_24840 [Chryseolinea sp.]